MHIEDEIFKKSIVNYSKLIPYGFNKDCVLEKPMLNNKFKAIITINNDGILSGKIIDLQVNEEYSNFRTDMAGQFVNKVKEEYISILEDIKTNCFITNYFVSNQANRITKHIQDKYHNLPEFLWDNDDSGVFRKSSTNKWYGIIMNISFSKLDNKPGKVEVLNIKLDEKKIVELIKKEGYYPAYHMNKKSWISIVLNDTLTDDEITTLIDKSYNLV
jgi:predicted DNA-binding protein (MmcQ/YjbR family)